MRERREGRIVNISSIGGKISVPHLLPYSASKFALVGYSEGLRAELLKDGIRVTTVCPGLMRTGSTRQAYFKSQNEAEHTLFALGDSLPGSSVSAEKAARQIVNATRRGDAELIISLPAVIAAKLHGVAPGLTSDVLGLVNRMLPGPGGIGEERRRGAESETPVTESPLMALSHQAARANNEMG
jgi:short-subunit dehydrogenase